jgi:hypothetical protein
MTRTHYGLAGLIASALVLLPTVSATTLARLSFEELTDDSELIVSGTVTRSWAAWDAEHKYIWTHYEMSVVSTFKGAASRSIEFAEVGGIAEGVGMDVAGTVAYQAGENVLIFLARQPNGYLRTTGWGQGKYRIDTNNRLHGDASLRQVEFAQTPGATAPATSLRSLEGITLAEIAQRIAARVRTRSQGGAQ